MHGQAVSQQSKQLKGARLYSVEQYRDQQIFYKQEHILQEVAVALVYNGISHVVMMMTAVNLTEFAIGFSLSEGIISDLSALYAIEIQQHEEGFSIEMTISARAFALLKQQRRNMTGRSGCGLCGIESLQQLQLGAVVNTPFNKKWLGEIESAIDQFNDKQVLGSLTGAAHAAAWVKDGIVIALFEDVGRHNALDKLLGYMAKHEIDVTQGFVLMSSRASYELIRKCVQFNIAMLATISAPSSLAIDLAQQAGLTLASFCREQRFSVYTQLPHLT
ncbi:formate dehydrogenase accessory sulfurtransferase FdhD [Acinetobacter sichuanensis]|uniref:formate dehydrogenase accessory sulfurtransferase FdhD n=1 Tax=Acinetobacter sichuanensis TaxID=2136183 RepID=UPI00280D7042|nr:formate dehydrogenase accessory sulfurtransferase FdhD [Acinetobacter sichuanensis]MDQ9022161.1 formate dehydrogenase accessory sulfurtransferase FdhD [Acinetobacter sichuanensis]